MREHVLVVGGGFSGTLLGINLLRHDGPRVTLVERRPNQVARGVAYSAADDSHLLNVRAANMSALPDDPDHFVQWLEREGEGGPRSFVRRTNYGRYLSALLDAARARAGDRLVVETGDVSAVEANGDVRAVIDGAERTFDRAVLAVGNLPPHAPPGIDADVLPRGLYCDDPWAADIADGLSGEDEVLLLGTGLTAIDAALLLDRRGFEGRIVAMSRRGLVPRAHVEGQAKAPPAEEKPARTLPALVEAVREQAAAAGDWRAAVDALRPVTQLMWAGADLTTRQRFLRHLRPFWDVHRHRLAPQVAARIEAMVAEGRLAFQAGKLAAIRPEGVSATVDWRPRGADATSSARFRRIVNCTGPQGDLKRAADPLLRQLMAAGAIRPDAARLGIDVAADTRVIGADGRAAERLYAIGPMTRGAWWEVVAVPDIRVQAWNLARTLANAHWVGGEGL
ncbi:FAD-dependent oxidoreductase [Sphingomonas spermidinifaciens]|uniref:FAD-dependent oxidoreductase n=1 Tax=Sphingomonas spermidinifaciens TaxID=1141889 RepID=A0A2A4B9A5_9SPHN|nr:FAD/NAD(P)-binding protein [Sphingomonas spermidinifaciens]PCD04650.1 FAD-dependent oxidoreductase [Sphingomonas spermidinifaciens]